MCNIFGGSMQDIEILKKVSLFKGISDKDILMMISCFGACAKGYSEGEIIISEGEKNKNIGIVLKGSINAYKQLADGARIKIATINAQGIFGDVLSTSTRKSPITVEVREESRIMLIPCDKILDPCGKWHDAHNTLLKNLINTISDKYFLLNDRIDILIKKTLRAKIAAYILKEAAKAQSRIFISSFDRNELSEYLNCDRAALSRELSNMKKEGIIQVYKSSFKILDEEYLKKICV